MSKKRLDLQMFADASAQLQNTTGAAGMTAEMKTYYEKTLLDLAEPALVASTPSRILRTMSTVNTSVSPCRRRALLYQ